MLEKLKKNINEWHYHSLAVTILAIITILKYEEIVLSIILITISTVLNGIGFLYNQNKRTEEMLKKLILKSREDIIEERIESLKNGTSRVLTDKEMEEIFNGNGVHNA